MPLWVMRFLPHGLIVAAVLFGVWWIYDSGRDAERMAADARAAKAQAEWTERIDKLERTLSDGIAAISTNLATRQSDITRIERTIIQPKIEREIISEKRLSDPTVGITDGLREAINTARAESACPARAAGGDCVALSAPVPVVDQ